MAECSYARCLQERRLIKRELLKWSKNMVYIVGLERVAEELMGRRKWKLYQEVLARSQSNANPSNVVQLEKSSQNSKIVLQQQQEKENLATQHQALLENHLKGKEIYTVKNEISENLQDRGYFPTNISEKGPKDNSTSITSEHSENPVTPIDWKPDEKCYFCIDGNLLTVNEKGDLVAESGPALSEAELANRTSIDSDSDSSDSSPDLEIHRQPSANVSKTLTSRLRDSLPPKMTSLESMAAHLAAVASIQGIPSGLGPFCPSIWYHQLAQHVSSATPPAAEAPAPISPSIKDSPSPSDATGEQPLDLSSKPSPNSSMSASSDPKQVFRAKPRMSAVTGRRTYTEEELHSALQDIISGKLGTRRAAVLYGIPRSTLRNKVYKIAMEQKREANTLHPPALEDLVDPDDEDKELSGDDERDDKILSRSLVSQPEDLARFATSQMAAAALQKIGKPQDNIETDIKPSTSLDAQMKLPQTTPQSQTPPNPWLDPNVLLQSILLSLGGIPGLMQPKVEDQATVRELFSNLMIQQDEMRKEQMKSSTVTTAATSDTMNNGKPNLIDPRLLMQNLPLLQQQQQQHPQQHQHPAYMYQSRLPKSEASETGSSVDMIEGSDDPSVILKIPSYKPVAGSSSGKNGEHMNSPAPSATPLLSRSPQQPNNIPGISPPLIRQSSESQSPPIFSLRDVIANSISRTFNQQAKEANVMKTTPSAESNDPHKRASISVIKNLGGTDISRFATQPNLLSNNASNSSQNASSSSGGVGGKGTRPKRGKYRNYDRDSLVEAVKAVQRGEMSVHRAGSYYGVPHSTLEYKVKERHLMRPRKREPKPQPLDDRTGGGSSSGSTSSKNTNIPGIAAVSSLDKMKPSLAAQKPALKNNPPFPSTSPNGMKVPIFDPAMAAQLQYTQQFFWPHSTGFGGLPMDFPRTPGAAGPPQFPPNAENFLASQMIQRFHEESSRITASNNISSSNTALPSPSTNNKFAPNNSNPASKSTRELAESLYDSGGANGSFLDGIIRKTLDRKTSDIPHGALIDQLVKNTRTPVVGSNTEQITNTKTKRPASPVHYPVIDIKRERSSPTTLASLEAERSSIETNISKESVECLTKKRDDFLLQMEDQQQRHHQVHHPSMHRQQSHHQSGSGIRPLLVEDLNGGSSSIHEQLGKIKSENEDNL